MSTLWTPGGERPIRRDPEPAAPGGGRGPDGPGGRGGAGGGAGGRGGGGGGWPRDPEDPEDEHALTDEEKQAQIDELKARLAETPAAVVIANHAFGLFELAALHLSLEKPQLEQARLAIDALGALVEGLGARLGEHAEELSVALGQLRMAYVQIHGAHGEGADAGERG